MHWYLLLVEWYRAYPPLHLLSLEGIVELSEGNNPLTAREREVLRVATMGLSIAEVARSINLSVGTVRNYLSTAIQKLTAHNCTEATRIAEQKGYPYGAISGAQKR